MGGVVAAYLPGWEVRGNSFLGKQKCYAESANKTYPMETKIMGFELTKHTRPSNSVDVHGTAHVTAGQSTSVEHLQFTKKALIYEQDMPTQFRSGVRTSTELALRGESQTRTGGELILASDIPNIIRPNERAAKKAQSKAIASGVRQLEKPRRSGERIVQRRVGWIATPREILVTVAERELKRAAEGKLSAAGSAWLIEDRRTYRNESGAAQKRVGRVAEPDGSAVGSVDASGGAGSAQEQLEATNAQNFPEGAAALGFLPAQVRSSVIARVPAPTQFDGVILQTLDPGTREPNGFEVNVLRMDMSRAVVVQGTRKMSEREWEISQAVYHLLPPEIEQA